MALKITQAEQTGRYPLFLEKFLPKELCTEMDNVSLFGGRIEEIRLRADRNVTLTSGGKNIFLSTFITQSELSDILVNMCGHSLYAYAETINRGYITLRGGIRVGVCGKAATDGDRIIGVYDISSMNIRIPREMYGLGGRVCEILRKMKNSKGVLIYSQPGVGKTTLLRSVAYEMANGASALRVSVIDSRGEIGCFERMKKGSIDVLTGYPKGVGIEIAARTMNAQLMICDEIGDEREIKPILYAQNCGVPLLASAHGDNIKGVLSRYGIRELHRAGIFGAYVRIQRSANGGDYKYTVTSAEVADDILQNSGRSDGID